MKKTALLAACAALVVGGMELTAPKAANAGIRVSFGTGYGYNRGYSNFGYNRGYSNYGYNRGFSNYGYNRGFSNYGYNNYNRGHYDYHPPAIVPHGNHYHVIPGHYDYHRGSHYGHRYGH